MAKIIKFKDYILQFQNYFKVTDKSAEVGVAGVNKIEPYGAVTTQGTDLTQDVLNVLTENSVISCSGTHSVASGFSVYSITIDGIGNYTALPTNLKLILNVNLSNTLDNCKLTIGTFSYPLIWSDVGIVGVGQLKQNIPYLVQFDGTSFYILDVSNRNKIEKEIYDRTQAITTLQTAISSMRAEILLDAHPVGSYYQSDVSTDPHDLFGGTWVRIKGEFLVGLDENDSDIDTPGKTGGEKYHTLTIGEMPSHKHQSNWGESSVPNYTTTSTGRGYYGSSSSDWDNYNYDTSATGGGASHNNMPPFLSVYTWKRIS